MFGILIKHFKNSFHTARILSNNNLFNLIRIFIIRFFYSINSIRNLQKTLFKNLEIKKSSLFESNLDFNETLKNLEENGYYDKIKLQNSTINSLENEINYNNFIPSLKLERDKYPEKLLFENLNDISKITEKYQIKHLVLDYKEKLEKNIFHKIATSDYLKNLAKQYLNSNNIFYNVSIFISIPFSDQEDEKKKFAQYFHYDCDYKKFFKVFIYLNDVDEEGGPHVFLKFSHKNKKFSHLLAERLNDEEIEKSYQRENIIKFVKNKGSMIIEDTFGLHKGETPTKNQRRMLIIEFGNCKSILDNSEKNYFKI